MKYLSQLIDLPGSPNENLFLEGIVFPKNKKIVIHLLALGDVGGALLTGLKLLGGDVLESIGIYDISHNTMLRYEQEMNQIAYPFENNPLPPVKILTEEDLFQCDVFLFCASMATPPAGKTVKDVRMAQYEANKPLVETYARMAKERGFTGLFAILSDPVDPLCKAALKASSLQPFQIKGYGLGVMNSRALYFAEKDSRLSHYGKEGRAFGPHGQDLVVADRIIGYDHQLSIELTKLTIESNLRTRELGFKPYIAPAFSSGVLSILLTLKGEWHYSSFYLTDGEKGAFLGAKNRMRNGKIEVENLNLPMELYHRIQHAFDNLCSL